MACIKAKIARAPLSLALLLALAACGGSGGGSTTGTATTPGNTSAPSDQVPGGGTGTDDGSTGGSDTGGETGSGDDAPADPPDDAGDPPLFSVANPFSIAGATSVDQVEVDNLFVFGDSYSRGRTVVAGGERFSAQSWSDTLQDRGIVDNPVNFAVGGANARAGDLSVADGEPADGNTLNTFSRQVEDGSGRDDINSFFEQDLRHDGDDLTIVYFGYNDLGTGQNSVRRALDQVQLQTERLLDAGAGDGDQQLFLTLLHDWDRNPQQQGNPTGDVEEYNAGLAAFANSNDDIIAVDLFTVFERIFEDPEAFGFDNVSTEDAANSDTTALYIDADHFGQRGIDIIAQVYQHYLTRAWDWSNSLAFGQQTIDALNDDIDQGLLDLSLNQDQQRSLSFFQVGNDIDTDASSDAFSTGIKSLTQSADGGAGVGMNYQLASNAQLGLVLSQYRDDLSVEHNRAVSGTDVDSQALSIYLDQKIAGFDVDTRLTLADNDYRISSFDAVVESSNQASASGSAMSLNQRVAKAYRVSGGWLQPFADLSVQRQEIESYTLSSPLVSDTRFSGADINDVWAGIGVNLSADPIKLGHDNSLKLSSSLGYRQSLHRDEYRVTITDTAFGGVERAELERGSAEQLSMNLQSALDIGKDVTLGTTYGFTASSDAQDDIHQIRADLTFRF